MLTLPKVPAIVVGVSLFLVSTVRAGLVWDNGVSSEIVGYNISSFSEADDFVLVSPASFDRIRVWILGNGLGNDLLAMGSDFNGTLGWAIHADNGGIPGAILFFGSDSTITLIPDGIMGPIRSISLTSR